MKLRLVIFAVLLLVSTYVAAAPTCAASPSVTLYWPVAGKITGTFSVIHPAIDIAAPLGKPVHAAAEGTVTWAGWRSNGGGNVVDVNHGSGVITSYNHLLNWSVKVGQFVSANSVVGHVGATGHATGPHLHFAVLVGSTWINPLPLLHQRTGAPPTDVPNTAC